MRGVWAIALLSLLITPSLWAQRGGGHAAGSMGHAGFSSHAPAMPSHGFSQGGSFNNGIHFHPGNNGSHNGFHNGFTYRRYGFRTWPWYYGYPAYYYPYPYYGGFGYSSIMDSNSNSNPYPAEYRSDYSAQNTDAQQAEIDRLQDEVERLSQERESRAPQKPEPHEKTTLVFKDKHTQEVENYAIVGETVWVFTELRAVKIPLSSIDVDATTKLNDERGVGFSVPQ
jgi:hypothetical protein